MSASDSETQSSEPDSLPGQVGADGDDARRRLEEVRRAIDAFVAAMDNDLDERLGAHAGGVGELLRRRIAEALDHGQTPAYFEVWAKQERALVREQLASLPSRLLDELRSQFGDRAVSEHLSLFEAKVASGTAEIIRNADVTIQKELLEPAREWAAARETERLKALAWKTAWFGGGALSLIAATVATLTGQPASSNPLLLPGLFLFGLVSVASGIAYLEGKFGEWAVERPPRESLHGGQFVFCFVGLVAMSVVGIVLVIAALYASVSVVDGMHGSGWGLLKALPWIGGGVAALCGLAFVAAPLIALYRWFGSRRALERLRDEALFKIASDSAERGSPISRELHSR